MHTLLPIELRMKDWRIASGDGADLPDTAKGDFTVRLLSGPYGNLVLDLATPSGSRASLCLEADDGHFKLLAWCPEPDSPGTVRDDTDAILYITPKGLLAISNASGNPAAVFDGDSVRILSKAEADRPVSEIRAGLG